MKTELFASLLRNLLHIRVLCPSENGVEIENFEKTYCYNPRLQPELTERTLSRLLADMQEKTIYGLQDKLGICIHFFRFSGCVFLVGPFVRSDFDAAKIQGVLAANRISASVAASIRVYYSAFPVVSSYQVRKTILACARSFLGSGEEYMYCPLQAAGKGLSVPQPGQALALDYSVLFQRYDVENRFLRTIETGDTENALIAYHDMNLQSLGKARYINAVYQDPSVGLSMVRALARKAAERGGAPVVEINEITQRAVQKMFTAQNVEQLNEITHAMILELTEAVRQHRLHMGNYSIPIQRTAEYLRLNFSQQVSLAQLAKYVGFSENYLSAVFKKEVGMTISQYIAHLRCAKAAEMLRDTAISIQEISSHVGYTDNNYFVKVFRKQYGVTPSEYRAGKGQA